jgi:hypothetical protein
MASSQSTHALVTRPETIEEAHAQRHAEGTYCDRCGAKLLGGDAWGHDTDCPRSAR